MPRICTKDRLRTNLMEEIGPVLKHFNTILHQQARELVQVVNENYLYARGVTLKTDPTTRWPIGLVLSFESIVETHTGLESGYIRWRYGKFTINKSLRKPGNRPITLRVPKSSRANLHYERSDFATLPMWHKAPHWEQQLVMYTEKKVRPIREALHAHKESQRLFLHAPLIPNIDTGFAEFLRNS